MDHNTQGFCFGTLALGANYRALALELAKDLEKYSPNTPFVVLTEKPDDFISQANVLAFKHQQRLYCDNDKKFLIEKALSLFNCCICIDADMRILAPIPQDLNWLPGLTARSCTNLFKHHKTLIPETEQRQLNKVKQFAVVKKIAQKLDLDIEEENVKWINEFLFIFKKDSGKEIEFLNFFEMISYYLEVNGVYLGSGTAMGLAAAKVGLPVRHDIMENISFFDDRIERIRISKGEAAPTEKIMYFEKIQRLKYPERSLIGKVIFKLGKNLKEWNRFLRLRLYTLSNFDF
jgi:hypothetical protein